MSGTANRTDRLERITNTLLENLSYFITHQYGDMIGIELRTTYDGEWYDAKGNGESVEQAKMKTCQEIAEKIISDGADVKEKVIFTNADYLCSLCGKPYARIARLTSKSGEITTTVTCDSDTCDYTGITDETIPIPESQKTMQ